MPAFNDGGPAFPQLESQLCYHGGEYSILNNMQGGMSLLDWFAGMATDDDLDVILPRNVDEENALIDMLGLRGVEKPYAAIRAYARYQHAAAMLAERERRSHAS